MMLSQLLAPYGEPQRGYHNFQHIVEMLCHMETFGGLVQNRDAMRLAILFHDVVYDTTLTGGANERASADAAVAYMKPLGYTFTSTRIVDDLIMATTHVTRGKTNDERLIQDFDLLGFALSPDFKVTAQGIRREYGHVTDQDFWPARIGVLGWFLDRDALYHTKKIHKQYEQQARDNIVAEINWILEEKV